MHNPTLIDVRSPNEFARGHLAGAVNLPLDQLVQGIDTLEAIGKSSALVIYCQSGARSAMACSYLAQQGYTQVVNGGAMMDLLMQIKSTMLA